MRKVVYVLFVATACGFLGGTIYTRSRPTPPPVKNEPPPVILPQKFGTTAPPVATPVVPEPPEVEDDPRVKSGQVVPYWGTTPKKKVR